MDVAIVSYHLILVDIGKNVLSTKDLIYLPINVMSCHDRQDH